MEASHQEALEALQQRLAAGGGGGAEDQGREGGDGAEEGEGKSPNGGSGKGRISVFTSLYQHAAQPHNSDASSPGG